jgi:hypothetical protein
MGTPQIILLTMIGIGLLLNAYKHGQPRTDKYNIFLKLIDAAIFIWILYAGGFFS